MSGMLATKVSENAEPQWIRPVHTVRVWIPCEPLKQSEGSTEP
jgi:hypothetical protein